MTENLDFRIKPTEEARTMSHDMNTLVSDASKKKIEKAAEEQGFASTSEACRHFIMLGMKAYPQLDPRNNTDTSSVTSEVESEHDSLTLRDILPEKRENALDMSEGEVLDAIDGKVLDEVIADPKINREGREIWLNK